MIYDLIIIGAGPAGAAAAVYAGRKRLKTALIAESLGGQSIVSDSIENWIGFIKITGFELAKALENHIRAQEGVEIKLSEKALEIQPKDTNYIVRTDKGSYEARSIILAPGGRRRRLGVAGEDRLEARGVSFCSTCDAPLFKGKAVAVIGGGNAGLEAVIDLFPYALKVYLINRGPELKGDPATQEQIRAKGDFVTIINNAQTREIFGDKFVEGIKYLDSVTGEIKELAVGGVFVEIGSIPNSEIAKGLVEMNEVNEIIVDHKTGATSRTGIFACGDVTDEIYKQNNISAGDGVAAALSAYNYLLNIKKQSPARDLQ